MLQTPPDTATATIRIDGSAGGDLEKTKEIINIKNKVMNKVFILVLVICKDGLVTTETTVFNDGISAKVRFSEELKYYMKTAGESAKIYDGYDHKNIWFDINETNENFWVRANLNSSEIM